MYNKTLAEFIEDCKNPEHIKDLLRREVPAGKDAKNEEDSWKKSLPLLAEVLNKLSGEMKNSVEIVLEQGYFTDERADVILVGKKDDNPVMLIIENKQWSDLKRYEPMGETCVVDPIHHDTPYVAQPCCQVDRYKFVLDNTNGYVQDSHVSISTAVFMHNATSDELNGHLGPFDNRFEEYIKENPVFIGKEGNISSSGESLFEFVKNRINCGKPGLSKKVYTSIPRFSEKYKSQIGNIFGSRENLLKMLDEKQIAMFEEIKKCVYDKLDEKTVFIVQGDPGTGKTFVAEMLLSYLYNQKDHPTDYLVKLLLKNKDPRKALQRKGCPKGAISYGLKGDTEFYDCLICDESHRMLEKVWKNQDDRNHIEAIIKQSRVAVFFYDKKQRVHVNDYITVEKIIDKALELGVSKQRIISRSLKYQHRCLDSDHFIQMIDRILYEPEMGLEGMKKFSEEEKYKVWLVDSPHELIYKINELNDARNRDTNGSRVLAGKGRTDGVDWEWMDDNEPLERRKTVGPFRNSQEKYVWNLHEYIGSDSFASDDKSVHLIGCLDTSQGLDFEYVGLIFAPDIKIVKDNNVEQVDIFLEGHQHGDPNLTDYKNFDQARKIYGDKQLKTLIRNTYRVLASRGEKGCFIYCCDKNLQEYLGTIIPTLKVSVPNDYVFYPEPVGRTYGYVDYITKNGAVKIIDKNDENIEYWTKRNSAVGLAVDMEVSFFKNESDGILYANDVKPVH